MRHTSNIYKSERLRRLVALGVALVGAGILGSCGDSSYHKVHVTMWDGAFIMDSVTLGVVGWQYDQDMPTNGWDPVKYANFDQYLYKYHLQDSALELVATLEQNTGFYATYPGVLYSKPWVVYETNDGTEDVAMYNMETQEKRKVFGQGAALDGLSPNGQFLCLTPNTGAFHEVVDVQANAAVVSDTNIVFRYADDTLAIFATLGSISDVQGKLCRFNPNNRTMDSIGELAIRIAHVTSDKSTLLYPLSATRTGCCSMADLYAGLFHVDTLSGFRVPDDIDVAGGTYTLLVGRTLYYGNYLHGVAEHVLLAEQQTPR